MSRGATARRCIESNPFYVLGLAPDCQRMEIEREGQKLLGMLELGIAAAATYQTPLGPRQRTPELVREALSELRDPQRRLGHELWARLDGRSTDPDTDAEVSAGDDPVRAPWPDAMSALGWGSGGRGNR